MSYLINNQQNMNEIIFANRNKNYGAYVIRSAYGTTLLKALLLVVAGSAAIMITAYYLLCPQKEVLDSNGQILPNVKIYTNTPVDLTPKDNKPASKSSAVANPEKQTSKQPQTNATPVVIDSTEIMTSSIVTQVNTSTVISTSIAEGTVTGNDISGKTNKPGNDGTKSGDEVRQIYGVDSQPEFEGGMAALYKFVSNNLRYPEAAAEIGKGGVVYVKFVVDENGKVGSLTLQNKNGYGLDEEALRVVRMIPKFKTPAKLDGVPVKVYYQLPIRFNAR